MNRICYIHRTGLLKSPDISKLPYDDFFDIPINQDALRFKILESQINGDNTNYFAYQNQYLKSVNDGNIYTISIYNGNNFLKFVYPDLERALETALKFIDDNYPYVPEDLYYPVQYNRTKYRKY